MQYTTNTEPMNDRIKYRGDYIGQRFGKLTVVAYPSKNGIRQAGALCVCDCGEHRYVDSMSALTAGITYQCRTCGKQAMRDAVERAHEKDDSPYKGLSNDRLFLVWRGMLNRCGCLKAYADVEVCDEWKDYFSFRKWALSTGYDYDAPRGKCTIDRINPFGNYEPSNCRFVDMKTQLHNRRSDWLKAHPDYQPA